MPISNVSPTTGMARIWNIMINERLPASSHCSRLRRQQRMGQDMAARQGMMEQRMDMMQSMMQMMMDRMQSVPATK